ncbi:MAG: carbohydrate porin [Novosphingobium sp.]
MGRRTVTLAALATGCALTFPICAQADEAAEAATAATTAAQDHPAATHAASTAKPPHAPHPRETLTGDWGGLRTDLKDAGIAVRADYVSETFSAVDGGQRKGTAYTQQIRAGVDLDMDKLAGVSGGIIHITLNDRRGVGISSDFVGNRLPIQEAAGGPYARLSELSWEQNFDDGRLNLRAGFFAMGNDLGGLSIGCNLVNAAFCAHPLSESGSTGWYNYPNARWGLAVRYKLRPDLIVRTGVYQTNPDLGLEENAFRPFAGKTTGVVLPLELEYDPGTMPGSRVLPGHYKVGFYYDTANADRQGTAGRVSGRFGGYVLGDQMILRDKGGNGKRGLSIFGHFTANPEQSAQMTRWYAAGLVKLGTFKGRDADTIALGMIHAQVNERLRALHAQMLGLADGYTALPEGETAIEMSYGIQVNPWLNIRPDVQYIVDPGAFSYRKTDDALALGVQVKMQI